MTTVAPDLVPSEAAVGCVDLITVRPDGPGRWILRRIHTDPRLPAAPTSTIDAASIELALRRVCQTYGVGRCSAYQTSATAAHVFVGNPS